MESPRLLSLALVIAASLFAGCAADETSAPAPVDDGAEVDELNATSLRASTAIEGTVVAGSSATVSYERGESGYPRAVPYLAVEIVAAPVAAAAQSAHAAALRPRSGEIANGQSITVHGDFPGRPRVLVVDESFKQLTAATGKTLPDGSVQADFAAPRGNGKRFILVRDSRWSKPMSFQIGVGQ